MQISFQGSVEEPLANPASPSCLTEVQWQAAAAGAVALVLAARRGRKEEEERQLQQAQAQADAENEARAARKAALWEQLKLANWRRSQESAQLRAQEAEERAAQRTERKEERLEAGAAQPMTAGVTTAGVTEDERREARMASAKYQEYREWLRQSQAQQTYASFREKEVAGYNATTGQSQPWWKRAWEGVKNLWKDNFAQPWQDFADRMVSAPNPKGPLYGSPQTHALLTGASLLVDRVVFGGRISQFVTKVHQAQTGFLDKHPTLRTATNVIQNAASFVSGFGSQVLDDVTFGLYGRLTHLNWENGSDAFQYGRQAGRVVTQVAGQVEIAAGLAMTLSAIKLTGPTLGAAAACAGVSGGLCLPLGGLPIAVETAGVLVGTGMAAHGGAMLMRSAGNPISGPQDPTLRYGSNTGDTARNAQILRQNMEQAGVQAPSGYEAHHIVPSRSQRDAAIAARKMLWEKFGIDINAAENGVFVPKNVNAHLNNSRYEEAVFKALEEAQTREKAIEILRDIAEQIRLTGTYP